MGAPKTSEHIKIQIKMPYPSHDPPTSPKVPNQDLKDMDVICTFKIKIKINKTRGLRSWPSEKQK